DTGRYLVKPRIRTVKPEALTDEELWDLEQDTGLPLFRGFVGLWCHADREGRFEWRPRPLKAGILPYWDGDFARVLDALASRGFVIRYEAHGRAYGVVRRFKGHQFINNKEPQSALPEPPESVKNQILDASKTRERRDSDAPFPSLPFPVPDPVPDPEGGPGGNQPKPGTSPFRDEREEQVFRHWADTLWSKVHETGQARATPKRVSPIRARLREGFTVEQLCRVIDAIARSPFHLGEN